MTGCADFDVMLFAVYTSPGDFILSYHGQPLLYCDVMFGKNE